MKDSTSMEGQIFVRSHVARDLLQNAALFKTDKLVVWEYVSNGLEYIDEGTNPIVKVTSDSKNKKFMVEDNGRGMDWIGLKNFFIMHGENIDRLKGKPGRGRFGTGKSAAFGIADILRLTTVRNGKRSIVELKRNDISKMKSEDPIPVIIKEREISTEQNNGTMVEIEGILLKSLDQTGIIKYIERHLAKWKNASVFVNNHECEFNEPPVAEIKILCPDGAQKEKIGAIELTIKIASAPLEEELRGISIYSHGIWHETTLAGNENREMSQYIFGEVDVPKLDKDKSPIPPFDLSRSMRLNPNNELVKAIYGFIGFWVDKTRRELVNAEKKRKESADSKKLAKQAREIANLINDDFSEFREKILKVRTKRRKGFDIGPQSQLDVDALELIFGSDLPANIVAPEGDPGSEGGSQTGGDIPRSLAPQVEATSSDTEMKGRRAKARNGRISGRGGFNVEFKPMGIDEKRARYVRDERAIYINLDHPQLVVARGGGTIEDTIFKKLAYEVAFTEYAIVLASELNSNGEYTDTSDAIVDIRETVNRIARKSAQLYST